MAWYYLIYALMLASVSSVLIRDEVWRRALLKYYLPLLGLVLLVFVVCRTSSVDHDYQDYLYWFNSIVPESFSDIRWNHDPMFFLTSWLATATGLSYKAVLAVYSSLALIFVFIFCRKVRDDRWLTVLLYITFCHFFIEYQMTAIRAAVAIPLAAISLSCAGEEGSAIYSRLYIGAWISPVDITRPPIFIVFHCRLKLESRLWMFALIPFGIVAYVYAQKRCLCSCCTTASRSIRNRIPI